MRIGAVINGFERQLLNHLNSANAAAAVSALRLATEKRVNRPSDDPAAFVNISSVESRLAAVKKAQSQVAGAASLAAESQIAVDSISSKLSAIRTALVADENRTLTTDQRAAKQALIDGYLDEITALARTEVNGRRVLDGSADYRVSGLNSEQLSKVTVYSTGGKGQLIAAEQAELTYTGTNRAITTTASVTLTGNTGSTTITVTAGDALTDVAQTINDRTETTGLVAEADGNKLYVRSASSGSAQFVKRTVNSGTFNVTGGSAGTDYGVDAQFASGPAISGRVIDAATQATLTYTGAAGNANSTSTLTLAGGRGSTAISVTSGEALSAVATRVNNQSHKTGIAASVDGNELTLTALDYGTRGTIDVDVTSGAFAVTGGNDDGTAQGANAVVEINGQRLTGNTSASSATLVHTELSGALTANTNFRLTGATGFHDFALTSGTTLSAVRTAINAETGTTGVTATISDDGFDLLLTSTVAGSAGKVAVKVTSGTFATTIDDDSKLTAQNDLEKAFLVYTGASGKTTSASTLTIAGKDGSAAGIAVTSGQTLTSLATTINGHSGTTGVEAIVSNNTLLLRSLDDGEDAFVDVDVTAGTFALSGGDGAGHDIGRYATTDVSGADAVTNRPQVDGNRVTVAQQGLHAVIDLAADFTGRFDPVTISDQQVLKFALSPNPTSITRLALPSLLPTLLGGNSGKLTELKSGGGLSGLDGNTSAAIRVVDEALAQVSLVSSRIEGFSDAAVATSEVLLNDSVDNLTEELTSLNGINSAEETLLQEKNLGLASNVLSSLAVMQQQRQSVVDLLKQIAGL
jgi:flagellin-like hook-associated protein FlgL